MTFILNNSVEGYDERLSYFSRSLTNTSIEGYNFRNYNPLGQIDNNGGPIEFEVLNHSSDHIDLSEITLMLNLKILKSDKTAITLAGDDVILINLSAATSFRQLDFSIQQTNINSSVGANYPYKCMFDVLLDHGKHSQKTKLSLAGFFKDSAKVMDDHSAAASANVGLTDRTKLTHKGNSKIFKTKIFSDICQQNKFLPGGIPLNIKFYPSTDLFRLLYNDPTGNEQHYCIHIKEAKLSIPFVKLNPSYLSAQTEILKKEAALIKFTKSSIKTYTIGQGDNSWIGENLFQDSIPQRLVVALVDSKAYAGHNEKNPFNFQHFNCRYLNFEVNGQTIGSEILEPNFTDEDYASSYSTIFDNLPRNQPELPNISYPDFGNGYALFLFNVFKPSPECDLPSLKGQTRLSIKFKNILPTSVTLILYATFNAAMTIDETKNITLTP